MAENKGLVAEALYLAAESLRMTAARLKSGKRKKKKKHASFNVISQRKLQNKQLRRARGNLKSPKSMKQSYQPAQRFPNHAM